MAKDYYKILGVKKTDSKDTIKKAYRDAVKRLHPDVKGVDFDKRRFYEIQEAYETLGDEERRRMYDRSQEENAPARQRRNLWGEKIFPGGFAPFEDIFSRFGLRPVVHERGYNPGSRRIPHRVEVILNPDEALLGGEMTLQVPLNQVCTFCNGTGVFGLFSCPVCGGTGEIQQHFPVKITIPSGVEGGTILKVPFEDMDGYPHTLTVFIEIDWFA